MNRPPRAPKAPATAFDRALRFLTARPRSETEIRRKLVQAGYPIEEIDPCIARLKETGFLNDEAFARQLTRSRLTNGGRSTRRVRQELQTKGVSKELIADAVAQVVDDEGYDEKESALALAIKKAVGMRSLAPLVARRRLYGFLARKGFAPDAISAAVKAALARSPADDTDEGETQ